MRCSWAPRSSAAARPNAGGQNRNRRTAIGEIADSISRQPPPTSVRGRHPPLRHADHAADGVDGDVRAAGERLVSQALAGILPVRRGARRRPDAGAAADGDFGDAVAGCAAHGQAAHDRQAAIGHSGPGVDGCPVHGQDRHADRGENPHGTACGCGWPPQRTGAGTGLSQQLLRNRPEEPA